MSNDDLGVKAMRRRWPILSDEDCAAVARVLLEDRRGDEERDYLAAAESEDLVGDAAEVEGGDANVGVGDNPDHLSGFAVLGDDSFDLVLADAQVLGAAGAVALEAQPLLL